MRRLDPRQTLEYAVETRQLASGQFDRLLWTLAAFYRRAGAVLVSEESHLLNWHRSLSFNRRVLLDPRLGLAAGLIREIDRVQRRFLVERSAPIVERVRSRHIVGGHGDLRPGTYLARRSGDNY